MERRDELKRFHVVLNTADGVMLMDELKKAWGSANPLHENAQTMGYNLGLQQAYLQLLAWQEGNGLND